MKYSICFLLLITFNSQFKAQTSIPTPTNKSEISDQHEKHYDYWIKKIANLDYVISQDKAVNSIEYNHAYQNRFITYYKLMTDTPSDILYIFFDALENDKDKFCDSFIEVSKLKLFPEVDEYYGGIKIKMDRLCSYVVNSYNQELIDQLKEMRVRDQKFRGHSSFDSSQQHALDSLNQKQMIEIFANYGYPDRRIVGIKYEQYLFYILLHSPASLIEQYKHLVLKSMKEFRLSKSLFPLMIDRLKLLKGEPQIYGTQQMTNEAGELELYKIEDKKTVNEKRKEYGLDPIKIPD